MGIRCGMCGARVWSFVFFGMFGGLGAESVLGEYFGLKKEFKW